MEKLKPQCTIMNTDRYQTQLTCQSVAGSLLKAKQILVNASVRIDNIYITKKKCRFAAVRWDPFFEEEEGKEDNDKL